MHRGHVSSLASDPLKRAALPPRRSMPRAYTSQRVMQRPVVEHEILRPLLRERTPDPDEIVSAIIKTLWDMSISREHRRWALLIARRLTE